jgi:chaperonin GroES
LHDRVIIKRLPEEEKTAGGLFIPDSAKERPMRGTVIAAGPGTEKIKMQVKKGDLVLFAKYAGTEFKMDGEECSIMRQDEILAVIEK